MVWYQSTRDGMLLYQIPTTRLRKGLRDNIRVSHQAPNWEILRAVEIFRRPLIEEGTHAECVSWSHYTGQTIIASEIS